MTVAVLTFESMSGITHPIYIEGMGGGRECSSGCDSGYLPLKVCLA